MREQRCERLKAIRTFGRKLRTGAHSAAADVEENKGGDDERVNGDSGAEDVGMKEGAGVKAEVAATGESEAADDECYDSEENEEAEDVGE